MKPEEELIHLRAEHQALREQLELRANQLAQREELIAQLLQRVQTLEKRVGKNSHNSSLPPSLDRFARQKKARSLRKPSGKQADGQPGRGATLEMSKAPNEVITLPAVTQCQHCQEELTCIVATSKERHQVVDVPRPRSQVTEYQGEWKQYLHCQGSTSTAFPAGVQYGPRVGAMAVYPLMQQLLPWGRTRELFADLVGMSLIEGTLARLLKETARQLVPVEEQIKAALSRAALIHQDETGMYVQCRREWIHVTSTESLTHYQVHPSRGHEVLDAIGILAHFTGTSMHDGWATYFLYACTHALCLVHVLRELTYLVEELGLWWAAKLKRLLLQLLQLKEATEQALAQGQDALSPEIVADWQARLLLLLSEGDQLHPPVPTPKGKHGKAKQHPVRNLLDHLRKHQQTIWACLQDLRVPFDNNLAEQDIRMVKVQQKVSGAFRGTEGRSTSAAPPCANRISTSFRLWKPLSLVNPPFCEAK